MNGGSNMKLKDINTERLTLREINMDDWKSYIAHVTDADEIYVQYGYEATDELIEEIQEPTPGVIYYSIIKTDSKMMVGYIGILELINNIEFHIFKEHRNNHYCTEALTAFLKAYMNGEMTGDKHDNVVAETLLENKPSCRVLENAGFIKEGAGFSFSLDEETNDITYQGAKRRYIYKED